MKLATTNTSPNQASHFTLLLQDLETQKWQEHTLYREPPGGITVSISMGGLIYEKHAYRIRIMCDGPINSDQITVTVNDADHIDYALIRAFTTDNNDTAQYEYEYKRLNFSGNDYFKDRIFYQTFGFVRVVIEMQDGDDAIALSTRDIACMVSKDKNQAQVISRMLDALTDTENAVATQWMLSCVSPEQSRFSLFEGNDKESTVKTIGSILDQVGETLLAYENNLFFFRQNAYSRILKQRRKIPVREARRIGHDEVIWIAQNMDMLHQVRESSDISFNGRNYLPDAIYTTKEVKSHDNYENQVVMTLLDRMQRLTIKIIKDIKSDLGKLDDASRALTWLQSQDASEDGMLPSLIILNDCSSREEALLEKAQMLRSKCVWLRRAYRAIMPVTRSAHIERPRRTKVFQEICPYRTIYELLLKWIKTGSFTFSQASLAMQTYRVDKLYEYYALFVMLQDLADDHFAPDDSYESPIRSVTYTQEDICFKNENQVANLYHLARQNMHVTLYYQPVIYGDEREENGITLHRSTKRHVFSSYDSRQSYWTPDYLLIFSDGLTGEKRQIIVDAKFRWINHLIENEGSGSENREGFRTYLQKYKDETINNDGTGVEAVWLLCGPEREQRLKRFEESSWVMKHSNRAPSAVASLSPYAFPELLAFVGINQEIADTDMPISTRLPEPIDRQVESNMPELTQVPQYDADGLAPGSDQSPQQSGLSDHEGTQKDAEPDAAQNDDSTFRQDDSFSDEQIDKMMAGETPEDQLLLIYSSVDDKRDFFNPNSRVSRHYGLTRPLFKKNQPTGHDRRYYHAIQYKGQTIYGYVGYTPKDKK